MVANNGNITMHGRLVAVCRDRRPLYSTCQHNVPETPKWASKVSLLLGARCLWQKSLYAAEQVGTLLMRGAILCRERRPDAGEREGCVVRAAQSKAHQNYQRDLGNGLVLRWSTKNDLEGM